MFSVNFSFPSLGFYSHLNNTVKTLIQKKLEHSFVFRSPFTTQSKNIEKLYKELDNEKELNKNKRKISTQQKQKPPKKRRKKYTLICVIYPFSPMIQFNHI